MLICVWCNGAISDDGKATATPGICERCLPPIDQQIAAALTRMEARRVARERPAVRVA
jgi:hypothetical protein